MRFFLGGDSNMRGVALNGLPADRNGFLTIAYDGLNPIPPTFCYLKPYYNDPNKSYFEQLEAGEL